MMMCHVFLSSGEQDLLPRTTLQHYSTSLKCFFVTTFQLKKIIQVRVISVIFRLIVQPYFENDFASEVVVDFFLQVKVLLKEPNYLCGP